MEYPKIENLYARNPETHEAGPDNGFRMPEVGLISKWLVLEKVDGMNMRVIFKPMQDESILIKGRTDNSNIPGDLLESINEWATWEKLHNAFWTPDRMPEEVVMYGEGYGAGIQKGGHYRDDKDFILFDVVVDGKWLDWDNVVDISKKLAINHVPVLSRDIPLQQAEYLVDNSALLGNGHEKVEGIVLRTDPYLFTWRGHRIMAKYKVRDLSKEESCRLLVAHE